MIVRKWEHAGMTCAIRHGIFDIPCGYVLVPEGHPLHGVDYYDCEIDAYAGLTFSGEMIDEDGWWLGFDMGHGFDVMTDPDSDGLKPLRTDDECARETERLAEMLADLSERGI